MSVRTRDTIPRRSNSETDDYCHSNGQIPEHDISFDHSLFDDNGIDYDDQWDRAFDDGHSYIRQPATGEKLVATTFDSGVISNVSNKRVNFADYHADSVRLPKARPVACRNRTTLLREQMSDARRDCNGGSSPRNDCDLEGKYPNSTRPVALPADFRRVPVRPYLRRRQDFHQPNTYYYQQDGPYTII